MIQSEQAIGQSNPQLATDTLVLSLDADGQLRRGEQPIQTDGLNAALQSFPGSIVRVRVDQACDYRFVKTLLGEIAGTGRLSVQMAVIAGGNSR